MFVFWVTLFTCYFVFVFGVLVCLFWLLVLVIVWIRIWMLVVVFKVVWFGCCLDLVVLFIVGWIGLAVCFVWFSYFVGFWRVSVDLAICVSSKVVFGVYSVSILVCFCLVCIYRFDAFACYLSVWFSVALTDVAVVAFGIVVAVLGGFAWWFLVLGFGNLVCYLLRNYGFVFRMLVVCALCTCVLRCMV